MSGCTGRRQSGMHEINTNKKLYLGDPVIKFNQIESSVLSIVDRESDFQEWFYNNFIQLVIGKKAHWGAFLFANSVVKDCPWINSTKLERNMIRGNVLMYLKDNLDLDMYIWLNIETIDIPIYDSVIKYHDILIYGYDDDKHIFYCSDFFSDGHYQRNTITYEQMEVGFKNMMHHPDTLGVVLIRKKENTKYLNSYTDSIKLIYYGIKDYLSAIYPFSKYLYMERSDLQNHKYGIEIYKVLIEYCKSLIEGKDEYIDYRMFDLLYQHKKIMSKRIQFIIEKGYLTNDTFLEQAQMLERRSIIIRNSFIKYLIKSDQSILLSIMNKLDELNKYEVECYEKLLKKLEQKI